MTGSDQDRVRFRSPPAVETLQGVFFRPLPKFTSVQQGLLWAKHFRSEFPIVEEKPPLEHIEERFGEALAWPSTIRWKLSDRSESPRLWARSECGDHVIQIQRDAILTNWLKQDAPNEYYHYEKRRVDFESKLRAVGQFLSKEQLGELEPLSCLMTYINHLPIESPSDESSAAEEAFTFWRNATTENWLPKPDQLAINVSYPMPENSGRLHIQISPAIRSQNSEHQTLLPFELTVRGQPSLKTIEGALEWLDLGHEWIIRGFVDITNPRMHAKWERLK